MPLPTAYRAGTVSVSAGGTVVTGSGTNWLAAGIRAGDVFSVDGLSVSIESVDSATQVTLADAWPGAALSASPYEVRYTPDATRVLAASRQAIETFEGASAEIAAAQLRKNNFTAARAPLPSDDDSQGYAVGSRWLWQGQEWVRTATAWRPARVETVIDSAGSAISEPRIDGGARTVTRSADGTLLSGDNLDGVLIQDVTLDMNKAALGDVAGHGIRAQGDDITIRGVTVYDFGTRQDGTGGGTGVLVTAPTGSSHALRPRIEGARVAADPNSHTTVGWLFADSLFGIATNILAEDALGGIGYAHELKNDARYNNLATLTANNSKYALVYGQEGGQAPSYNLASGVLSESCRWGLAVGQNGVGNLFNGVLYNTGTASGTSLGVVQLTQSGASDNAVFGLAAHGTPTVGVEIDTQREFVQIASFDSAPQIVKFQGNASKSVVEVAHPGKRTSILGAVADTSGQSTRGATANIAYCMATGERIGSLSGTYHDRLESSGAIWLGSHFWRYEAAKQVVHSCGTDGSSGNSIGINHATPDNAGRGRLAHILGATPSGDRWTILGWGQGETYEFRSDGFCPTDPQQGSVGLGRANRRWGGAFITYVDYGNGVRDLAGAGSPEGVLTAGVGSTYRRTDGAAGTSFYVKESGSGNTGWVAK